MPIPRLHFDLGIDAEIETLMRNVVDFLQQHKDEAFSLRELWERDFSKEQMPSVWWTRSPLGDEIRRDFETAAWEDPALPLQQRRFLYALAKLVDHGVLQERHLAPDYYYSLGRVRLNEVLKS